MTSTRERLLDAARDLLDEGGVAAVTMAAVARAAEVSRQAAYLHFEDRSQLLVALVDRLDREADLETHHAAVRDAPTAALAIEEWACMQLERNPRIAALARALDGRRHEDEAARSAWRSRMENRLRGAREIVGRLAEEGVLHQDWDREEAAIFLVELTSFRVWDDLVNDFGVPPHTYVRMIVSAALHTLGAARASTTGPIPRPRSRAGGRRG